MLASLARRQILVAVNPFKVLEKGGMTIYDPRVVEHYLESDSIGLSPHIYKTSADAYVHSKATPLRSPFN